MLLIIAIATPLVFGFGVAPSLVLAIGVIYAYQTPEERTVSKWALALLAIVLPKVGPIDLLLKFFTPKRELSEASTFLTFAGVSVFSASRLGIRGIRPSWQPAQCWR